jgi:hypothetical protein
VLVIVLLLGTVWRLGGFAERRDVVRDLDVGAVLATGPYELRFTAATAQRYADFGGAVTWKVTMVGEGRTTGKESIAPETSGSDSMLGAKDPASGLVQTAAYATHFRTSGSALAESDSFTPGLPMQPYSVEFRFPESYRPGSTVTFVVYDLDFRDTSLLGNQDPHWAPADTAHRLRLPVEVLPESDS